MRAKGITYDTGFVRHRAISRARFETEVVRRERFGGKVAYAAVPLERVDWAPFDFVGVDLYRSAEIADQFADGVRRLVAQGKPVAITEFGSTAYRGAGDRGARAMEIVEYDKD